MSEAISLNFPKDFNELKPDAEIQIRQGGLLGFVSPEEFSAKVIGGALQSGSGTVTTGAGSVVFPTPFASAPTIVAVTVGAIPLILSVNNVTTTGFDIVAEDDAGAAASGTINWIAIG